MRHTQFDFPPSKHHLRNFSSSPFRRRSSGALENCPAHNVDNCNKEETKKGENVLACQTSLRDANTETRRDYHRTAQKKEFIFGKSGGETSEGISKCRGVNHSNVNGSAIPGRRRSNDLPPPSLSNSLRDHASTICGFVFPAATDAAANLGDEEEKPGNTGSLVPPVAFIKKLHECKSLSGPLCSSSSYLGEMINKNSDGEENDRGEDAKVELHAKHAPKKFKKLPKGEQRIPAHVDSETKQKVSEEESAAEKDMHAVDETAGGSMEEEETQMAVVLNEVRTAKKVTQRDTNKPYLTKSSFPNVELRKRMGRRKGMGKQGNKKGGSVYGEEEQEAEEEAVENAHASDSHNQKQNQAVKSESDDKILEELCENVAQRSAAPMKSATGTKTSSSSHSRVASALNCDSKPSTEQRSTLVNSVNSLKLCAMDWTNGQSTDNSNNSSGTNNKNVSDLNSGSATTTTTMTTAVETKRKAPANVLLNVIHNCLQNALLEEDEFDTEIEHVYSTEKNSMFSVQDLMKSYKGNAQNLAQYRKMYFKNALKTTRAGRKSILCSSKNISTVYSQIGKNVHSSKNSVNSTVSHLQSSTDNGNVGNVSSDDTPVSIEKLTEVPPMHMASSGTNDGCTLSTDTNNITSKLSSTTSVFNDSNSKNGPNVSNTNKSADVPSAVTVVSAVEEGSHTQEKVSTVSVTNNGGVIVSSWGKRKREKDSTKQAKKSPVPTLSSSFSSSASSQGQISPVASSAKSSSQPPGRPPPPSHVSPLTVSPPPFVPDTHAFLPPSSPTTTRSSARLQQIAQSQSAYSAQNLQQQIFMSSSMHYNSSSGFAAGQTDNCHDQANGEDMYEENSMSRLPHISASAMSDPVIRQRHKVAVRKLCRVEQYLQMCEDMYFGGFRAWSYGGPSASISYSSMAGNSGQASLVKLPHENNPAEQIMYALILSNNTNNDNVNNKNSSNPSSSLNTSSSHSSSSASYGAPSSFSSALCPSSAANSANNGYNNNIMRPTKLTPLELLTSPLRKPHVLDLWGPKEIALFEAAICKHGKDFNKVQRIIQTKSTKEIVDLYYLWKKTSRYVAWKEFRKLSNTIMHPVF